MRPLLAIWLALLIGCATNPTPKIVEVEEYNGALPWGTQTAPPIGPELRAVYPEFEPSTQQSYLNTTLGLFFTAYHHTLSRADGATCRFEPTCSGFAKEAIHTHGLWGFALLFARLQRNHQDPKFYAPGRDGRLKDPVEAYSK